MTELDTEDEARNRRREERFRCIADPTVREARRKLRRQAEKMRDEETQARKRYDEEDAEKYREAGNALEDAIAELGDYFKEGEDGE